MPEHITAHAADVEISTAGAGLLTFDWYEPTGTRWQAAGRIRIEPVEIHGAPDAERARWTLTLATPDGTTRRAGGGVTPAIAADWTEGGDEHRGAGAYARAMIAEQITEAVALAQGTDVDAIGDGAGRSGRLFFLMPDEDR